MSLFTPEQMQAIGARAFANNEPRPEGKDTWQLKAKQKGYDDAKAAAENNQNTAQDAFFSAVLQESAKKADNETGKTLKELIHQREEIETRIQAEHAQALQSVKDAIAEHGFTVMEVFGVLVHHKNPRKQGAKVAPKYRDIATGATWTGRGKPPAWIAGKDRAQYLIQS